MSDCPHGGFTTMCKYCDADTVERYMNVTLQRARMTPEVERLIKEAADDWYKGSLSAFSAMTVIYSLFHPAKVTAADMEWAQRVWKERCGGDKHE